MKHRSKIFTIFIFVILLVFFVPAAAEETKIITIEWIVSDECLDMTRLAQYCWIEDGNILLYDFQIDANERTIQNMNPETGIIKPAVGRDKALNNLQKFLTEEEMPDKLSWPEVISDSGRYEVYTFKNDIFLLDLVLSDFTRITESDGEEKAVRFSPDSSKISFVRDNDLYVYDIEARKTKRITDDGSDTILNGTLSWVYWEEIFGRQDIGYWWSDDSNYIAYLKTDESPVGIMHFVDFKPQTPELIKQRYPKAGQTNPIVTLHIADIEGNELARFNPSEIPYEYIARVKWLPDSNRICIQTLNRDQTKLDIYFMDRDSGRSEHIMTEQDAGWIKMSNDLYFLDDGQHFIWQSQRDGFAHLYLFTMDGELVRQITKGDWSVSSISDEKFWVLSSIAFVDERREEIYFGAMEKSSTERHLYRIKFDGTGLERITSQKGCHQISFSNNGNYYLDVYSSIKQPPKLSLHSNDGKLERVISESKEKQINQLGLQYPQLFTVSARDGFAMPAMLLKPKDFDPSQKYPVLVNVYGGPGAPTVLDSWSSSILTDQILSDNGFLVFRFDNRSATDISKKLTNLVVGRMWAECELNDLVDAARWLKQQPYVDGNNIGLWGASGGGSYTLLGLTQSKEFKAGVAIAPVTDWHYYDTIWAESGMKRPQDNAEGYEKTSFVKRAKDLHGRLLLVHGTADDNVHPQNCWAFADALIEAGKQFDMMIYPMRKHGISDNAAKMHLFNRMLEFWNQNLKEK